MTPDPPEAATTLAAMPPARIDGERQLIRCWELQDAPLLLDAMTASLTELRRWTPWVIAEPFDIAGAQQRIALQRAQFAIGPAWAYGIFDLDGRVLGSVGLYERIGPQALEIGYWIRSDATGRGHARAAAELVRDIAFAVCGAERVEIRCYPDNAPSNAIPARMHFVDRGEILLTEGLRPGESGQLRVWEQQRRDWAERASGGPATSFPAGQMSGPGK